MSNLGFSAEEIRLLLRLASEVQCQSGRSASQLLSSRRRFLTVLLWTLPIVGCGAVIWALWQHHTYIALFKQLTLDVDEESFGKKLSLHFQNKFDELKKTVESLHQRVISLLWSHSTSSQEMDQITAHIQKLKEDMPVLLEQSKCIRNVNSAELTSELASLRELLKGLVVQPTNNFSESSDQISIPDWQKNAPKSPAV